VISAPNAMIFDKMAPGFYYSRLGICLSCDASLKG